MKRVKIIGAGQLGSRHLQALQSVSTPLEIEVVDPSPASLSVAKERFEAISSGFRHRVSYSEKVDVTGPVDVAIVATNSNARRRAIEMLLESSSVGCLVLEKLLFDRRDDYQPVSELLAARSAKAWVNCPMRVMPVYQQIREELSGLPIIYRVTGSQFGLVTNAIHYLDHVCHLTGCQEFSLDTSRLLNTTIPSKRQGFLEVNGILTADFADGSLCEMICYPGGSMSVMVEIFSEDARYIVRESEGKAWSARAQSGWNWLECEATIPYQSQMTAWVVKDLLTKGDCGLTPYSQSVSTHLQLLDPLVVAIGSGEPNSYPFT